MQNIVKSEGQAHAVFLRNQETVLMDLLLTKAELHPSVQENVLSEIFYSICIVKLFLSTHSVLTTEADASLKARTKAAQLP